MGKIVGGELEGRNILLDDIGSRRRKEEGVVWCPKPLVYHAILKDLVGHSRIQGDVLKFQ